MLKNGETATVDAEPLQTGCVSSPYLSFSWVESVSESSSRTIERIAVPMITVIPSYFNMCVPLIVHL